MKKIIYISVAIILFACQKDFVVKDIKDKTLTVNAPANNTTTSSNSITFWWELLDGAEKYNIQIVKPNFNAIQQLITDTNTTSNKLTLSLNPGTYQWRIKGVNNGGSTAYQTFNLVIDSTTNLSNQLVVPISPAQGLVTKQKVILFSWNALNAATSYSIEISLNNAVVNYSLTNATNYSYTLAPSTAANYTVSWRVKALNSTSISQYNIPVTFTLDLLPPSGVSIPSSPTASTVVKDTTFLKWNISAPLERQYDSLFVYADNAYTSLVRTTTVTANQIRINAISPSSPLPAGTSTITAIPYWWRLKSVDAVGNTSGFSSALNFQLIQ